MMLPKFDLAQKMFADCGLTLTNDVYELLDCYAAYLVRCNNITNLTSITEPHDILVKHFIDSILLCNMIDFAEGASVIDVGTGAGFPLVPIKIYRPDLNVTLLDSQLKRVKFLEDLTFLLRIKANIMHDRAENVSHNENYREKFDVCVSRAVASLPVLSEFCLPYVKVGGFFCAMKGPNENAMDFADAIKLLGGSLLGQNDYELPNGDSRRLVVVEKISQTPTEYPRKSAHIMRNPL